MTGSSVNFQPVRSATHAVLHASRVVSPSYLLPQESSFGTVVVLDDSGSVASTLEEKMALASRQARAVKGYSPVWEGVLNLRRPEAGEDANSYRAECAAVTKKWCEQYEKMSGHKVLRVDVHLDEGHIENGKAVLNAHAHIIADRTDEHGRVKRLLSPDLRKLQTLTAKVTGLQRGENSLVSKKKHIGHQAYKYLAERGALQTQQAVEKVESKATLYANLLDTQSENSKAERKQIKDLKATLADLKAQYAADRAALVASGQATQKDYQALKLAHEKAVADLKAEKSKTKELAAALVDVKAESSRLATALVETQTKAAELATALAKAKTENAGLAEQLETAQNAQEAATRPQIISSKPLPSAKPKTASEAPLADRIAASLTTMLAWIKNAGGRLLDTKTSPGSTYAGPVKHADEHHAVHDQGRGTYVIHQQANLTQPLEAADDATVDVKYGKDGRGSVTVKARSGRSGRGG